MSSFLMVVLSMAGAFPVAHAAPPGNVCSGESMTARLPASHWTCTCAEVGTDAIHATCTRYSDDAEGKGEALETAEYYVDAACLKLDMADPQSDLVFTCSGYPPGNVCINDFVDAGLPYDGIQCATMGHVARCGGSDYIKRICPQGPATACNCQNCAKAKETSAE